MARRLGVSRATYERWEMGREPSVMACNLLRLIELHPQFVLDELEKNGPGAAGDDRRSS